MTQLEALKIAYGELSSMMPYGDENNEIFEAAEVIEKMIHTRQTQAYKNQQKNSPTSRTDKKRIEQIDDMFADVLRDL